MEYPRFEIYIATFKVCAIEIQVEAENPTDSDVGIISVVDRAQNSDPLIAEFLQRFQSTPGPHNLMLKGGSASFSGVKFVLNKICQGVWRFSEKTRLAKIRGRVCQLQSCFDD
ncbi:MAG: hypothetical protein HC786_23210 [Richelia sp. CSU_2_1]|nr:hypothetical protein [Richelia sp. CSU_2_1]